MAEAVKVTPVPEQTEVCEAFIVTEGVTGEVTVIVVVLEVAVVGLAQERPDVIIQ